MTQTPDMVIAGDCHHSTYEHYYGKLSRAENALQFSMGCSVALGVSLMTKTALALVASKYGRGI